MRGSPSTIDLSALARDPKWIATAKRGEAALVDRACMDLIQRKRDGQSVRADDYVACFPVLGQKNSLLDLIDADICVSAELGQEDPQHDYVARHPDLAQSISDLAQLDDFRCDAELLSPLSDMSQDTTRTRFNQMGDPHEADPRHEDLEFSCEGILVKSSPVMRKSSEESENGKGPSLIQRAPHGEELSSSSSAPKRASKHQERISQQLRIAMGDEEGGRGPKTIHSLPEQDLVATPPWFVPRQCIAVGPGHWMIRGRDEVRGTPLAFKVVRLPAGVPAGVAKQLLDVCEAASRVQNPSWVTPIVATVQNQHLGIIRSWWFARAMPRELPVGRDNSHLESQPDSETQFAPSGRSKRSLFMGLSSIAFAIAAAHHANATHGGVSAANILIDHDGGWKLVDAVSNRAGISRYLNSQFKESGQVIANLETRKRFDIQDLIKTISNVLLSSEEELAERLIPEMRSLGNVLETGAAEIGSLLMDVADCKPIRSSKLPVKKGIGRWFRRT